MNEQEFKAVVLKSAKNFPLERIQFPGTDDFHVSSIPRGILFVYAAFSGPALRSWKSLLRSLIDVPEVQVYVINNYTLTSMFVNSEIKGAPSGYGDTYWIKKGKVISRMSSYGDEQIESLVQKHSLLR